MRIGYFGGSFDPPHRGHIAVASAAAQAFSLDRILFVPTGHQPLKPSGSIATYADRLAMVTLLCESVPASPTTTFVASSIEAPLPNASPNYTVDTLRQLRLTLAPTDRIFLLIGADAFLNLRHWRSPDTLLSLADFIVVSRPGFSLAQLDTLSLTPPQRTRIHLLPTLQDPASATLIRHHLATGQDCTTLLPPTVLNYIHDHHLYST